MCGAQVAIVEKMELNQTWLRLQQTKMDAQYGLSLCDWQISRVDKTVSSRRCGTVVALASYTMIGSFCATNGTWLWAWANPALQSDVTMDQQQTLKCVQQVELALLAQPVLLVNELPCLWQDQANVAPYAQRVQTAVDRLVSMAAHSLGGMGVQCYVNPTRKLIGWVVLHKIYAPVVST